MSNDIANVYNPPAYLDKKNISPETFLANYVKFLPLYIGSGHPAADTMATYETAINLFLKWCRDVNMHPFAVEDLHIRLYQDFLMRKQMVSPTTVRLKIAAIKAFYHMAVKLELIKFNPCDDIPLPRMNTINDEDFKYYTVEQLGKICKTFSDMTPIARERNTLIIYLMGVEGLRRTEVMRLNDEDIDFERKTILIRGKGHSGVIYPCEATMDALTSYLNSRGPVEPDGDFTPTIISLSHRRYGMRITRIGIHKIVDKALNWAGLKYYGHTCHTLRHSCGTNLYHETKDIRVVQETLRHKTPTMSARYSHVDERSTTRPTRNIAPKT